MDVSVQSLLMTVEDLTEAQAEGYAKRHSTLLEYHQAQNPSIHNNAAKHINAGREAYLLDRSALEMGTHPLIEIHDVVREIRGDGAVGIVTPRAIHFLSPDTLLAWM